MSPKKVALKEGKMIKKPGAKGEKTKGAYIREAVDRQSGSVIFRDYLALP